MKRQKFDGKTFYLVGSYPGKEQAQVEEGKARDLELDTKLIPPADRQGQWIVWARRSDSLIAKQKQRRKPEKLPLNRVWVRVRGEKVSQCFRCGSLRPCHHDPDFKQVSESAMQGFHAGRKPTTAPAHRRKPVPKVRLSR